MYLHNFKIHITSQLQPTPLLKVSPLQISPSITSFHSPQRRECLPWVQPAFGHLALAGLSTEAQPGSSGRGSGSNAVNSQRQPPLLQLLGDTYEDHTAHLPQMWEEGLAPASSCSLVYGSSLFESPWPQISWCSRCSCGVLASSCSLNFVTHSSAPISTCHLAMGHCICFHLLLD